MQRKLGIVVVGAALAIGIAGAGTASAQTNGGGLLYGGVDNTRPAGVGTVFTLLSLQSPGSSDVAAASVSWDGSGDVRVGDWTTGSNTQTRTLGEVGFTSASDLSGLRLLFNINEPNGNGPNTDPFVSIAPGDLTLYAYSASGAQVFSAGFGGSALQLLETGNGIGTNDHYFTLDADAVNRLASVYSADLRIGLSARITDAQGGFETFSLGKVATSGGDGGDGGVGGGGGPVTPPSNAIPEPGTLALAAVGALPVLGGVLRRRRK